MPATQWRRAASGWLLPLYLVLLGPPGVSLAHTCQGVDTGQRRDCGYLGIGPDECRSRGCCWLPSQSSLAGAPWCFFPNSSPSPSYTTASVVDTGNQAHLELVLANHLSPELGPDFDSLSVTVQRQTPERLRVRIVPTKQQRWELPQEVLPCPGSIPFPLSDALYKLQTSGAGQPFSFSVTRSSSGAALFNTSGYSLLYKEQYLELATALPRDAALYGLGENTLTTGLRLPRGGKILTMWATDRASFATNEALYGAHPFLLDVRPGGVSHGVFLASSNGMDVVLDDNALTYKVIGGVIDLYFFLGPSPEEVIQQYQQLIGMPSMPPLWSLGFHQCKWGYSSLGILEAVVDQYKKANIPLEAIWSDIDYMDKYKDFTTDPVRFPIEALRKFVTSLNNGGQHWVPIQDAGIPPLPGYPAYEQAKAEGLFVRDRTGAPLLGEVWPGPTHWADWLHPGASDWWRRQLADMHAQVPFSGLWVDMNEASNFCDGDVCYLPREPPLKSRIGPINNASQNCIIRCNQPSSYDRLAYPPYTIHNNQPLARKALAMSATHHGGAKEYDTHNLFGLLESKATHKALAAITNRRPFVLSRSTFPGSGSWAAHWTGDNGANWDNLRWSVAGVLNSNLWGVPLAGADICGFNWPTTEELCVRWISVGAFYPFSRSHATIDSPPQELYIWPSVAAAGRTALGLRYRLLPYLYTSFYLASQHGGTVAKPLFFPFADDPATLNVDRQWLIGDSLMISPVMDPGQNSVQAYFPKGAWYSIWDYSLIQGPGYQRLPAPLGSIPVHIRGGSIVPLQRSAPTTSAVRTSPYTLLVALPAVSPPAAPAVEEETGGGTQPAAHWRASCLPGCTLAWCACHRNTPAAGAAADTTAGAPAGAAARAAVHEPVPAPELEQGPSLEEPNWDGGGAAAPVSEPHRISTRPAVMPMAPSGRKLLSVTSRDGGRRPRSKVLLDLQPEVQPETSAVGLLYADDGGRLDAGGPGSLEVWYSAGADAATGKGWLRASIQRAGDPAVANVLVERVLVLGLQGLGTVVTVDVDGRTLHGSDVSYDWAAGVLDIKGFNVTVGKEVLLQWRRA